MTIRYRDFPNGTVRKLSLFSWRWAIRDGATGPILAEGTTLTEWGAYRAKQRAMKAAGRLEWITFADRPVLHPLSPVEAQAICDDLAADQICIIIRIADWVHLYPIETVATADEVRALAAVKARTDARVDWHKPAVTL